jgi:hypothetical protein
MTARSRFTAAIVGGDPQARSHRTCNLGAVSTRIAYLGVTAGVIARREGRVCPSSMVGPPAMRLPARSLQHPGRSRFRRSPQTCAFHADRKFATADPRAVQCNGSGASNPVHLEYLSLPKRMPYSRMKNIAFVSGVRSLRMRCEPALMRPCARLPPDRKALKAGPVCLISSTSAQCCARPGLQR